MEPTLEQRLSVRTEPKRIPLMTQKWEHLLFLHWEIEPDHIQATLPQKLRVDTHGGRAYLGVVPFFMRDIRFLRLPAIPGVSSFLELNLRTYVYHVDTGEPGVWFYSLDANQALAVRTARKFFSLPYLDAHMEAQQQGDKTTFIAHRKGTPETERQEFRYEPNGTPAPCAEGSLEFFLTERYLFFSYNPKKKQLYRGQVYHEPYLVCSPKLGSYSDVTLQQAGFDKPDREPDHALTSAGVSVSAYALEKV